MPSEARIGYQSNLAFVPPNFTIVNVSDTDDIAQDTTELIHMPNSTVPKVRQ
jgi:hypothetical protein